MTASMTMNEASPNFIERSGDQPIVESGTLSFSLKGIFKVMQTLGSSLSLLDRMLDLRS